MAVDQAAGLTKETRQDEPFLMSFKDRRILD